MRFDSCKMDFNRRFRFTPQTCVFCREEHFIRDGPFGSVGEWTLLVSTCYFFPGLSIFPSSAVDHPLLVLHHIRQDPLVTDRTSMIFAQDRDTGPDLHRRGGEGWVDLWMGPIPDTRWDDGVATIRN